MTAQELAAETARLLDETGLGGGDIKACETFVEWVQDIIKPKHARCLIYAAAWGPTSTPMVCRFLERRADPETLDNLYALYKLFRDDYAEYSLCDDLKDEYQRRAQAVYDYIAALDLSSYGVPGYGQD